MLELAIIIIMSMVFAQVWVILIQPDFIFDWFGKVIDWIKYQRIKKLLTCAMCMAGQISLWTYLAFSVARGTYNPFIHISVIAVTIYVTALQSRFFQL